jgi:hypothetical protein
MEAQKNRRLYSILKYRDPPLWPTYIGERRTTFAKAYGIKVKYYGEYVGEHNGNLKNLMRSHWELERNIVKTHWEPRKNEKKILPFPNLKRKKEGILSACLGLLIGCMKFLSPKEFGTIFGLN